MYQKRRQKRHTEESETGPGAKDDQTKKVKKKRKQERRMTRLQRLQTQTMQRRAMYVRQSKGSCTERLASETSLQTREMPAEWGLITVKGWLHFQRLPGEYEQELIEAQ